MIKFDKRNYRKHNDRNKELIKKSLEECGAGRSIVIDNDDEIIAGNGIYEQAQALNIPVKVIETDGSELVVVKRTDLNTDDEKRKKLAVMDNSTSDSSEFDLELLSVDFEVPELKDMGIDIPSIDDCETDMPDLASGDKEPFQQMTFTLADGQAETIKEAISKAKGDSNFDYVDKMGNENSNGNALFFIIQEWLNGKC
jgi:sporulation protein YlmC with PRC-barrel domain